MLHSNARQKDWRASPPMWVAGKRPLQYRVGEITIQNFLFEKWPRKEFSFYAHQILAGRRWLKG
jgi:hypothetical protein